jgi:hypothetical protein
MRWRFHQIVLPNLSGIMTAGLREVKPKKGQKKVREKLRSMLIGMENLNQAQWPPAWTTKLTGHEKIFELRFEVWNVQYRPLFFFGAGQQIIFAFFALEIGDHFVPADAPNRAESSRQDLLAGRSKTYEIDIFSFV